MGINTTIRDGGGSKRSLLIDKSHAAIISDTGAPPEVPAFTKRPFSKYLTSDANSNDMRVVGTAAAPIDFYIEAPSDSDRYITTIMIKIADGAASLNQFGNIAPLTIGCDLIWQDNILGDSKLNVEPLQKNSDFLQLAGYEPSYGSGSSAFIVPNISGTSEGIISIIDIEDLYGINYGVRLPKGSNRRLILRIYDDTSAVDAFNMIASGNDMVYHGS